MTKIFWKLLWEIRFVEKYYDNEISDRELRNLIHLSIWNPRELI